MQQITDHYSKNKTPGTAEGEELVSESRSTSSAGWKFCGNTSYLVITRYYLRANGTESYAKSLCGIVSTAKKLKQLIQQSENAPQTAVH